MDYVNLDLKVTVDRREANSYQVIASTSGRDRRIVSERFFLSIEQRWKSIEQSLIDLGARTTRDATTTRNHTQQIHHFGKELFHYLIDGAVRQLYDDKKKEAERSNKPLRLRLTLIPFELVILPWELLCDERNDEYLCLTQNPEIILIRSIENTRASRLRAPKSSNDDSPLCILGMIADPKDQERLRGGKEKTIIEDALRPLKESQRVKLDWADTGKYRELFKPLDDVDRWQVFHFIGHGHFDKMAQQGQLVFENKDGNSEYIPAKQFRLALHRDLQLVVLNACETARGDPFNRFSSLAHSLAENGIPVVVAMQFKILDEASLRFAETFYTLLEKGEVIEEAVAQARRKIYSAAEEEYRLDWAAPLLYTGSSRSISLRFPARRQVSPRPTISSEEEILVVEAKTRELDPIEEEERGAVPDSGSQRTETRERGPVVSPPPIRSLSWLTGKGLSRRGKIGRVVAVLLLVLAVSGITLVRVFLVPLPPTFCIATDFSTTPGQDNSEVPFTNAVELAIQQNKNVGSGYTLLSNCADKNDNNADGVSDPTIGFQNLQSVISDPRVLGLVGPGSSDIGLKDLSMAAQNDFSIVSPNTTNPCLTQPTQCQPAVDLQGNANPYARICANDTQQGQVDAEFLVRSLHLLTAYVVNDGSVYGRGLALSFQSRFISDEGRVLDPQNSQISSSTPNDQFAQLAQNIVSQNPSVVFYGGDESSGIVALKTQLTQHGFTGPLMSGDGVALDPEYIHNAGSAAANTYATGLEPIIAKTNQFYSLYQAAYGPLPPSDADSLVSQAAGGYDAAMVLIKAIKYVIQTNPSAFHSDIKTLRESVLQAVQLNTSGYVGLTGTITLRNGDNVAVTDLPVYTITNGQWVPYSH